MDRDSLTLPIASSQWYTTSSLTPITSTPTSSDKDNVKETPPASISAPIGSSTPVFELTEELTPKRPLRSEVEREKRLSRPASIATSTSSVKGISTGDTQSLSGDSSNRNSIGKLPPHPVHPFHRPPNNQIIFRSIRSHHRFNHIRRRFRSTTVTCQNP